jgi:hypothetical protein
MSVQTAQALLCLGSWNVAGITRDKDILAETVCEDVPDGE